jgi:hypothetical protein
MKKFSKFQISKNEMKSINGGANQLCLMATPCGVVLCRDGATVESCGSFTPCDCSNSAGSDA